MEPENEPLEEEIPIRNHHFPGSMLVFGGVLPGSFTVSLSENSFPKKSHPKKRKSRKILPVSHPSSVGG